MSYIVFMRKVHVGMRVDEEWVARFDALGPKLSTPFMRPRRSELLRAALLRGLELMEADALAPQPFPGGEVPPSAPGR